LELVSELGKICAVENMLRVDEGVEVAGFIGKGGRALIICENESVVCGLFLIG